MNTTFSPRIRFNWGFWDGRADAQANRQPMWAGRKHHDANYETGYGYGRASANQAGLDSSDPAWREEQNAVAARRAQRRAIRNARPEPTRIF